MSATNKAKNKTEQLRGKAKEKTGKATNNRDLEKRGRKDRVKGHLKDAGEKVKDAAKH
jgi:uncharacterized protein YjbJ (UPF0337 family)